MNALCTSIFLTLRQNTIKTFKDKAVLRTAILIVLIKLYSLENTVLFKP